MRKQPNVRKALSFSAMLALLGGFLVGGGALATVPAQAATVQHHVFVRSVGTGNCPAPDSVNPAVLLRSANKFTILGASTVTNAGATSVYGDLGVYPGTAVTGFPPGVLYGKLYAGSPVAQQAQGDVLTAYNDAAGRKNAVLLPANIGGSTIKPGLYVAPVALAINGIVTLDAQGDQKKVFIFQIASTLTVSANSQVLLVHGARACNVFWAVGSSATLDTASRFSGNLMAYASVSLGTGADVEGRILAQNGAVTLLANTLDQPRR